MRIVIKPCEFIFCGKNKCPFLLHVNVINRWLYRKRKGSFIDMNRRLWKWTR